MKTHACILEKIGFDNEQEFITTTFGDRAVTLLLPNTLWDGDIDERNVVLESGRLDRVHNFWVRRTGSR